ncbi:hypothetical protein [Shewanella surugensis]|uniref:Uncharacterized protein n=1 Tax=Shewanella surugensis TaxID=212020 RepID=A0ABT0LB42_9GAMM|nr:hypothetical protein [Shewanella surugensis]MCL1124889.1 hypothetical protein [Shewanella surugensis]
MNALIKGMQSTGGLRERGKIVTAYMAQRQLLQDLGTARKDIYEVGSIGALERTIMDLRNWWSIAPMKTRVFTAMTTLSITLGMSAAAVSFSLLSTGVGVMGLIAASIFGTAGAVMGLLTSRSVVNRLSATSLFGLDNIRSKVVDKMTEHRIDHIFKQLELRQKGTVKPAMLEQFKAGVVNKLSNVKEALRGEELRKVILQQASIEENKLNVKMKKHNKTLIESSRDTLNLLGINETIMMTSLSKIDGALMSFNNK